MESWEQEWSHALNDLEIAIDIPIVARHSGSIVEVLYEESHRVYHAKDHIYYGLELLREMEAMGIILMPQVRYCWMNHDSCYDPLSTINEEKAAFLACAIVSSILPEDPIMSTKIGHGGNSIAGKILHDLDYAYFGLPMDEYKATEDKIRQEYSHLTDEEWAFGRKMFLKTIDIWDGPFFHPFFKKKFEVQAKKNLAEILGDELYGPDVVMV